MPTIRMNAFLPKAHVNDPARAIDLDDIRALLKANAGTLDMGEVRRYFAVFDREPMLEALLEEAHR